MSKEKVYVVGINDQIERMWRSAGYNITDTLNLADIVQFIGGPDVHPRFYDEQKLPGTNVSDALDSRDGMAFNLSKKDVLKVGICRGGQFLNVANGGALWQHVDGHRINGEHKVVDCLYNREIKVSSTHHQMMIPGSDAEMLAYAERIATKHMTASIKGRPITPYDPEVIWYEKTRSLCFQPHPEFDSAKETRQYYFDLIDTVL